MRRNFIHMLACALALGALCALAAAPARAQGRNSIEGRVTTPENRGLVNARVFLLNDGYGQRAQTYTDGSGRYQFRGLGPGNYYVQVEPAGLGYERQTQRVEVNPILLNGGGGGAEIFRVDFLLRPEKKDKNSDGETVKDRENTIFYQNVPEAAKGEYERGVKSLKKDDRLGAREELKHAIELFPDYYDALDALGTEYVKEAEYEAAAVLLRHAVEVNKNGWHSYYGLGVSLVELQRRDEGLDALRRSLLLNPESINAGMRLGIELGKDDQKRDEAIKVLTNVTHLAGKRLPNAYLVLASLYSRNKQYREAADALEAYLAAEPQTPQAESIRHKIDELRHKPGKPPTDK
jgi:tetratricopeptide (TPR) repeat protein